MPNRNTNHSTVKTKRFWFRVVFIYVILSFVFYLIQLSKILLTLSPTLHNERFSFLVNGLTFFYDIINIITTLPAFLLPLLGFDTSPYSHPFTSEVFLLALQFGTIFIYSLIIVMATGISQGRRS